MNDISFHQSTAKSRWLHFLSLGLSYHTRLRLSGLLFVAPIMLFFLMFNVYPMLRAFQISFTQYNLLQTPAYIGTQNYVRVFADPNFRKAALVTVQYILLFGPLSWILGFGSALLLNKSFPLRDFFRSSVFLPSVLSMVAMAVVFKLMLTPMGPVNALLGTTIGWITDKTWAVRGVAMVSIWRSMGYFMILFLVGLQTIPEEFYDAAKVDGAGNWAQFRHITLPLIRPVFAFIVIVTLIRGIMAIGEMMIMTEGGPNNWTRTLVLYIYQTGIRSLKMGRASAMSLIVFVAVLTLTLAQLKLFRVYEEE
jgi:multiple sugar transport system permease protein